MSLANLGSNITTGAQAIKLAAQAKAPTIMVVGGVVFMFAGGVWACIKTANELDAVLDKCDKRKVDILKLKEAGDPNYQKELARHYGHTVVDIGKVYAGPVLLEVLGGLSILSGHNMLNKRHVALLGAYQGLSASYRDVKKRAEDKYGKEEADDLFYNKEQKVEVTGEKDKDGNDILKVTETKKPYSDHPYRFYFDRTNKYWNHDNMGYNYLFLKSRREALNNRLHSGTKLNKLTLYEVLQEYGWEPADIPDYAMYMGWFNDTEYGDGYIDDGLEKIPENGNLPWMPDIVDGIWLEFNVDNRPLTDISNLIAWKNTVK